mmetsp:Transcript_13712/g.27040  ORF Transcript_13712/g.27040 Transcript_13712/m.27040 type:complete len:356 (+) Transcript_13712:52-1119(+)|eukprot:CAMPEP_0172861096 /NCGR_PEP_ID=MMETSP1075-20121228/72458_1 /TAXON_ID=2916 /ORGANISM="Ceratium fusus, Strain PA161109" /LENGTH=355 /DNA_ID=CAMNT_0013709193 /DNA_START=46 /DNA_END=1116 /DNA_ORIENTATION=-
MATDADSPSSAMTRGSWSPARKNDELGGVPDFAPASPRPERVSAAGYPTNFAASPPAKGTRPFDFGDDSCSTVAPSPFLVETPLTVVTPMCESEVLSPFGHTNPMDTANIAHLLRPDCAWPDAPWKWAIGKPKAASAGGSGIEDSLGRQEAVDHSRMAACSAAPIGHLPLWTPAKRTHTADASNPRAVSRPGQRPLLMEALQRNNKEGVACILKDDPQAAYEPFWDHEAEPPLCCATRCGCDSSIVEALLRHGADVEVLDARGRTPLTILSSTFSGYEAMTLGTPEREELFGPSPGTRPLGCQLPQWHDPAQCSIAVAKTLMANGANPRNPDAAGAYPLDVAKATGNNHLVQLWS